MKKNKQIVRIYYKKREIAYIIRAKIPIAAVKFFSKEKDYLQIGYHRRKKGEKLRAHYHKFEACHVDSLQEVFYIVKGKVKVNFYSKEGNLIQTEIIKRGDILFQRSLGHGFELLNNAEIFEVKQGPFSPLSQKKYYHNI